ncbi:MAG TPA: oxygen-independent coproporphyrinogen III oxidase [Pedobacter sp.]|uniref:oxygen-independent coproporphyrinogen III oxidase n=1 Tax=Pedobacter sp. TaxID=1411316 RepID=UPI002CA587C1|nr:oxygen-independent coproporphyrinogen III oxidase [Pedobacter sp.]HMI02251.1 oxygen-independent coproporphyrinogen III oxidase [Pedobacter sp.]
MNIKLLTEKYRVAAPRYTSYPTVPYWEEETFNLNDWLTCLKSSYDKEQHAVSLYIHLPFCESLCTYCGCNTRITRNHGVERPYIDAVLKEWDLYADHLGSKPVIKEIHLGGGTPTFFSPENLALLIRGLQDKASVHADAEFSIEGHPNNTTSDHLCTLYALGFRRISFGIQDFDVKVQQIINRIQSCESVKTVTDQARTIGYQSINYDLIYGLPLQTPEGLRETISKVLALRPDRIAFYSYAHVPWIKPGQRRYTEAHLPSAELKNKLYEMGRERFIAAGYVEIGMDHFTLKTDSLYKAELDKTLHRNFMGYTEHANNVLIGLGVSAISDCWTAFAQNVKTVESYLKLVNAGEFPVIRGHILEETDLKIRRHILNIMCKTYTSWGVSERQEPEMKGILERLKALAADGLVELREYDLKVTPLGKRFLRNICMAFDARLWARQPETQKFSIAD